MVHKASLPARARVIFWCYRGFNEHGILTIRHWLLLIQRKTYRTGSRMCSKTKAAQCHRPSPSSWAANPLCNMPACSWERCVYSSDWRTWYKCQLKKKTSKFVKFIHRLLCKHHRVHHIGPVHTTPKEFENRGFNIKTHQVFLVYITPEESEKATITNTKTKSRRFQIPPVWRAFSKSSVFVTD